MDIFKISVESIQVYKITQENFDEATKKQAPWYQPINGHDGWFAVCPACDNPVQIIGMMSREKPFGKHFLSSQASMLVPLKGIVDNDEYEWCPYASKNKTLNKSAQRHADSKVGLLIRQTLLEQFDRIIYLLEKCLGIKITLALAESMLRDYCAVEGWRYRGATRQNIPWIFAYMMQAKKLYGRIFLKQGLLLAEELCRKRPDLLCNQEHKIVTKTEKAFCDLTFSFIKHRRHLDGETLSESMELNIADSRQQTVCSKIIPFDYDFFFKLINSKDETYRNGQLLRLAQTFLAG
ncbi:hypothetical protein [Serratia microhaemolytica]|uniref:hypothetical protein n=1 Tax=Serratia microhaemolytica TaxID=2675110 RepID=UPI000FDE0BA3|nr:hypothetical protein [Serratia microhaemolytica]